MFFITRQEYIHTGRQATEWLNMSSRLCLQAASPFPWRLKLVPGHSKLRAGAGGSFIAQLLHVSALWSQHAELGREEESAMPVSATIRLLGCGVTTCDSQVQLAAHRSLATIF